MENDLFKHNHNPDMLLQYDSNFILFKRMPIIEEFNEAEKYLKAFHEKYSQKHVKFCFPDGEKISAELDGFLKNKQGYTVGWMELYAIDPSSFPADDRNPDIRIEKVTAENADLYLAFRYEQDSEYGQPYAEQKRSQHLRNSKNEHWLQILALYKEEPAGAADVIISGETAEIDGLVVLDKHQKKGIGSNIQSFVMNEFHDKTVILVADGNDTPKEMYRKQNYQYIDFQYEALKVFE